MDLSAPADVHWIDEVSPNKVSGGGEKVFRERARRRAVRHGEVAFRSSAFIMADGLDSLDSKKSRVVYAGDDYKSFQG
jgi:hypothetical protein